jgi:prevent-host-death family protein
MNTPFRDFRAACAMSAISAQLGSTVARAKQGTSGIGSIWQPGLMARMTATDAARNFSQLLNRVASGEEIEVIRSGATVAVISPPKSWLISAERFRELIATTPAPDAEFADEIRAARESARPPEDAWRS